MPRKKKTKTKSVKKKVLREARAVYGARPKTSVDIGSLIVRDPNIRKGRPRIASTGVTVMRIAGWHNMGFSPREIAEEKYGHITLAQVYAALAYYYANQEEIDADIAEEIALADELERRHHLTRRNES